MEILSNLKLKSILNPFSLICILFFTCLCLGLFITPEVLVFLGPMKRSLVSDIESVRKIALAEVMIFRIVCLITAIILGGVAIFWQRILLMPLIQRINNHEVLFEKIYKKRIGTINRSLMSIVILVFFCLLYIMFAGQIFSVKELVYINAEDGVIEQMTAAFFFIAGVLSIILSFKYSEHSRRVIVYRIFALAFFVMVGEEINWGQRFFNIATPGFIETFHFRKELNIHNAFGYFSDHLFIIAVLIYGFLMPVIAKGSLFCRKMFDFIGLPIASMGLAIGFLTVSMLHSWTVCRILEPPHGFRIEEMRELLTSIAFCLLLYESLESFRLNRIK